MLRSVTRGRCIEKCGVTPGTHELCGQLNSKIQIFLCFASKWQEFQVVLAYNVTILIIIYDYKRNTAL